MTSLRCKISLLAFMQMFYVYSCQETTEAPTSAVPLRVINIGGVLSADQYGQKLEEAVERINVEPGALPPGIVLNSTYILMGDNPIHAAEVVCKDLIPQQVQHYSFHFLTIISHVKLYHFILMWLGESCLLQARIIF